MYSFIGAFVRSEIFPADLHPVFWKKKFKHTEIYYGAEGKVKFYLTPDVTIYFEMLHRKS